MVRPESGGGGLQRVLQILLRECNGRMHWGKAGWPRYNACFDGSATFPDWCNFGCAVQVRAQALISMFLRVQGDIHPFVV